MLLKLLDILVVVLIFYTSFRMTSVIWNYDQKKTKNVHVNRKEETDGVHYRFR